MKHDRKNNIRDKKKHGYFRGGSRFCRCSICKADRQRLMDARDARQSPESSEEVQIRVQNESYGKRDATLNDCSFEVPLTKDERITIMVDNLRAKGLNVFVYKPNNE